MNPKNKKDWTKLFAFSNEKEIIEHITAVLSTSFAYEIEQLLKERGMTKKELAQKIGTSASYITQIMSGDKLVNMAFLAKIKYHLGVDFLVNVVDTRTKQYKAEIAWHHYFEYQIDEMVYDIYNLNPKKSKRYKLG